MDPEDIEEYKQAFQLHDKKKTGILDPPNFQACMRYLGTIYSDPETLDLMRQAGGGQTVNETQFLTLMGNINSVATTEDDVKKSFQVFDKDNSGTISVAELRFVMTVLGDKLDNELVESMLDTADPGGYGSIAYNTFVDNMYKKGL